jgi:Tfp pilus assembly protein PilO
MNNRTITASVLVAVLVVAVWWMFVFSGVRKESSDVSKEIDAAKAETRALETELSQLEDLEQRAPETEARLGELRQAVPSDADLAEFIEQANALGVETGVKWVSIAPAEPALAGGVNSIGLTISVEGGYFEVLDYEHRLETLNRLVVIDSFSLTGQENADAPGAAPTVGASITGRMFSQAVAAVPAPTETPTVAGGGGIAATPTGQES